MQTDEYIAEELEAWWAAQKEASWYDRNWKWFDKALICTVLALVGLAIGWVIGN